MKLAPYKGKIAKIIEESRPSCSKPNCNINCGECGAERIIKLLEEEKDADSESVV